ncbi:MAG TPA: transglutaminase domain-containing protein, partial [Candidatus Paceibacterota bacterium]
MPNRFLFLSSPRPKANKTRALTALVLFTLLFSSVYPLLSVGAETLELAASSTPAAAETTSSPVMKSVPSADASTSPVVSATSIPAVTTLTGVSLDILTAREHIKDNNLSPVIEERLAEFEKTRGGVVETELSLKSESSNLPLSQNDPHPFRSVLPDVPVKIMSESVFNAEGDASLEKTPTSPPGPALSALPQAKAPVSSAPVTTPESSSASGEIIITQNIKDRAEALNYDPLSILNFVRNNIAYEPYYGSKKGADATLIERTGNDADQASLLIALLRAGDSSGGHKTPARYRRANVKIDLASVMDLLGVEDPMVAGKVLAQARVPSAIVVDKNNQPLF